MAVEYLRAIRSVIPGRAISSRYLHGSILMFVILLLGFSIVTLHLSDHSQVFTLMIVIVAITSIWTQWVIAGIFIQQKRRLLKRLTE